LLGGWSLHVSLWQQEVGGVEMPMKALRALGKRMVGAGKKKRSKPPVSRPGSPDPSKVRVGINPPKSDPSKVRVGINPPKSGLSGGEFGKARGSAPGKAVGRVADSALSGMKKMLGKTAGQNTRAQTRGSAPRVKASYNSETNRVAVSRPKRK